MTAQLPYITVGVDGGGTGCRAAVGTPERGILGQANGGPGNVESDFEGAIRTITQCIDEALQKANLSDVTPDRIVAHIGVAGTNGGPLVGQTERALPYAHTTVTSDRATTVRGVLGVQDGYVVALGTGTIVAHQHNRVMRSVGGWGFYVSDQASGAWLGRRLLEQTVLAFDGLAAHSDLTQVVAKRFGSASEVFMFTSRARPKDYAALAPEIMGAAKDGDAVATKIVQEGAAYVEKGLQTLNFEPGAVLCLSGGLGPHYAPYLHSSYTQSLTQARGTALDGAFALACDVTLTQ